MLRSNSTVARQINTIKSPTACKLGLLSPSCTTQVCDNGSLLIWRAARQDRFPVQEAARQIRGRMVIYVQ
ncbi:hypothetical protein L917_12883, partial [Phytophthora nicotianae]